jgi:uncharacterized SAM-binding protein YcdF (DUF218 family)
VVLLCLLALVAVYGLMAIPVVAYGLADRLGAPPQAWAAAPLDILVVFDGDNARGRARESARIYRAFHPQVLLLGGDFMRDLLLAEGIPPGRIEIRSGPGTTLEQIEMASRRITEAPHLRWAILTSRVQFPRVQALATRAGIRVPLIVSPLDREPSREGPRRFLPSWSALMVSRDAAYELVALKYYRWRNRVP